MEGLRDLRIIASIFAFRWQHRKCPGLKAVKYKGAKGEMYGLFCRTHMNGVAL